jgi:hypothetical protein
MDKSKTDYVYVRREEWETVKARTKNIRISQNGVLNASCRPFGSGKNAGLHFLIPKGGGEGGTSDAWPAKVKSKAGANYIVDIYANGKEEAATETDIEVDIMEINYASTFPAYSWVIVHNSERVVTGGGAS